MSGGGSSRYLWWVAGSVVQPSKSPAGCHAAFTDVSGSDGIRATRKQRKDASAGIASDIAAYQGSGGAHKKPGRSSPDRGRRWC